MKVLSICGSLRPNSYNLSLLKAFRIALSGTADFIIYNRLSEIPAFQPDIPSPDSVAELRSKIQSADAIIIASPEYVHGIPGALKNALDWVVGTGEWDGKPTAIFHVTPSANEPKFVRESLSEVIRVMSGGRVLEAAALTVTGAFKKFDPEGRIVDAELSEAVQRSASEILNSIL